MKSYEDALYQIDKLNELVKLYDRLKTCGISYKSAKFYKKISVDTGYSMGERTYLYCKDVLIECVDRTESYAKSSKSHGCERYGSVVIKFNKKQLKEYVRLCNQYAAVAQYNDSKRTSDELIKLQSFVFACIESADVKRGKVLHDFDVDFF